MCGQDEGNGTRLRIWRGLAGLQGRLARPPTPKELEAHLEAPHATVHYHIVALEREGIARRLYGGHAVECLVDPPPNGDHHP